MNTAPTSDRDFREPAAPEVSPALPGPGSLNLGQPAGPISAEEAPGGPISADVGPAGGPGGPEIGAPRQSLADLPGVSLGLAALPDRALLDEAALAVALGVCKRTIRKMVSRYELPPPVRQGGRSTWLAGKVFAWITARMEAAERKARKAAASLQGIGA